MNPNIGFWVGSIHSSGSQFTTLPYTTNVDDHSQVSATAAALLRGCSVGVSLLPYDRPQPIIFMTYRRPKRRKILIHNCCTHLIHSDEGTEDGREQQQHHNSRRIITKNSTPKALMMVCLIVQHAQFCSLENYHTEPKV